ncbi:MAG: hypothetical protein JSV76_02640, partial [Candidatus Bathyarchaeota archaeon]
AIIFPGVSPHVPRQGEGYGLADAVIIDDPLKSWVIYTEYKDNRPLYYRFDLSTNDRLQAGLLTINREFIPDLTILGPGLPLDFGESFREEFEIPDGYGLLHLHGEPQAQKEYEPFTPASYYQVLEINLTVNQSGTYFLIVDSATGSGKVGVVLGYIESFTPIEWVRVPFDVAFVHHWEGQDYLFILLPMLVIVVGGLLLNGYYVKLNLNPSQLLAFIGSLTYFGSAATILHQMIIGLTGANYNALVFVTLIFIVLPGFLGYSVLRKVPRRTLSRGQVIRLLIFGILGIVFWAGYLLGPILIILSAITSVRTDQTL